MSNYSFVVHGPSRRGAIRSWVQAHAPQSEVFTVPLSLGRTLTIISRDVARSVTGTTFFRGTLIAPDENAIVFGAPGWSSAPQRIRERAGDHNGIYIAATWGNGLRIDRDVFGSGRLLTTSGRGYAAASDSLLVLAALRRAMGDAVSPHEEALLARVPRNEIVGQQISPDTIVSEIEFIPPGRGLRLSGWNCAWRTTGEPIGRRLEPSVESYAEGVRNGAMDIARTVRTLTQIDGWRAGLRLSGGYDSRLVLAGAVASGVARDLLIEVGDTGRPELAEDVQAAVDVARALDLNLQIRDLRPQSHEPEDGELTAWAASLLGIYDGYGPIRDSPSSTRTFSLDGLGAGAVKGAWGWTSLTPLLDRVRAPDDFVDPVKAQLTASLHSLGADPEDGNASEVYYLGYRNALHSSASFARLHMTGISPIMQFGLARVGHTARTVRGAPRYAGADDIIMDMAALLSPDVASHPYDSPTRNRALSSLRHRARELGGTLAPTEARAVFGHPDDVVAGASQFSLSVARAAGFVGALTPHIASEHADAAIDALPTAALRTAYLDIYKNALWRMEKSGPDLSFSGVTMPRISALGLFTSA
ncbi:hypothetical protein [Microbacterium suaedae]|uniref:hypothetical protein n=1 Tax=Microbacterium suaedae TaxID=2067813 RepID=UPI000DA24F74|nr:hypothetical protein [Microbacterium suaedae]